MSKRKVYILLITLMALMCSSVIQSAYLFKTLDARDGLTSSQVNCIHKDSRGFMWFGTPAGLYRYDGYGFKHFQCDSQDGSSLPDSYIESIQETLDGSLWIETPAGYCIYHPQTESFERDMRQMFSRMGINEVPEVLYIDRHKNLWGFIPKRGIVCYNMQQQLLFEFGYTKDANGIPQGAICSIGECKDGAIAVYNDGRIICFDVMHQQQIVWQNAELSTLRLRRSNTLRVFADQMDNVWLYGQGTLFVLDKKTMTWDTSIGNQLGLTGVGADYGINSMAGDRSGNIWLATNRHGLIKANVNIHEMEQVEPTSLNAQRTLRGAHSIQSVLIDDTDLLWVGTSKSGVAYWGQNIYKFENELNGDITAIAQDENGKLWLGTSDNGILGYEGQLASLKVTAMTFTNDGSLWVGSKQHGLTRIKNNSVQYYSALSDSARRTIIDNHINALCTDKFSNLWIATEGGLQVFNTRMETFSNYTKENGKMKVNNITCLFYGKDHKMLIGTSEGIVIMNIANAETKQFVGNSTHMKKFTNNYVTQIFEDSRGLIWVGTREGLNVLNLENDNLDYITEKQGLSNNNVCGIAEDKNHNMWISTSNGISRIVLQRIHEEGQFNYGLYNYSINDGLQSNEFNLGAILTRKDGEVVMGGLFGINWIRPKSVDETETLPRVMLTQLFIGEEEIITGHDYNGHIPLPQTLNESNHIKLQNDQNTFTIYFAAGNYNQSERLQFMYMMEGLDDDWRHGNALKHGVTFTNLSSGTYTLHVKAISAEGVVSNQERVLTIEIDQPWYFQWWMLLFYAAAIIIALYLWKMGFDQLRRMWNKKKALLEELQIQREEIKATSDDLRQPMAQMTSIIMNLSERESDLEEREQLNNLHTQMLQIITRVSDMQASLEHPEEKAKQLVDKHFQLNSKGEMGLPDIVSEELTSEIRTFQANSPTAKFRVIYIDDSKDFVNFVSSRLKYIYDFHAFDDIENAVEDIETTMPDLIICKEEMKGMTGSQLCNNIKTHATRNRIRFVLVTEGKLTQKQMQERNITLSADEYLFKPFNLQEAIMKFNLLLGIGLVEMPSNLIEGAETRMLEGRNSSMTTATESDAYGAIMQVNLDEDDEIMKSLDIVLVKQENTTEDSFGDIRNDSMADAADRRLISSIEQYVQQNMSRGQINLEEMAQTLGMSMRPFFQKVKDITGKTPAEVVRDIRLKHACTLLKKTNINMSELANNVGFTTGDHFINIFKERFGISPSEYRQKYRQ